MQVIHPPHPITLSPNVPSVFLAGSIDMGNAIDWQKQVIDALSSYNCTVLNPRRPDWDSSWEARIENPVFYEQVQWELDGLEKVDKVLMYLAPNSQAPISLLEFGLTARLDKLLVCCPTGFWRKGNVDIVCQRFGIAQVEQLEALIEETQTWLSSN